jgi:hypothetical protein
MARIETNKAPRKILVDGDGAGDSILISAQTKDGTHLATLTVVDGNTLPEFLNNVIQVVHDDRFELRGDNQLYLKAGVLLEPGKYSIKLSVTDAEDSLLARTQTLKFKVDNPNDTHFTGAIDASGTKDDGTMLWGTGNPSTDYTIAINNRSGVEFGFNVHYRTGDQIAGHLQDDGFVHFRAPSGHQVGGVGSVSEEALNRSATSVDYALIAGLNGTDGEINDYVVKLFIDLDATAAVDYKTFTMVNFGTGINYFVADDTAGGFGDTNGMRLTVAEDSINFGYGFLTNSLTANTGDFQAGTYDVRPGVGREWHGATGR